MNNNPLSDIIVCDISLSSPGSSEASFGNILIVVPKPDSTDAEITNTTETGIITITQPSDLIELGFTTSHAAYVAASIAFAQDPKPVQLMIAIRQEVTVGETTDYEAIDVTLNRVNDPVWYGLHLSSFNQEAVDVNAAKEWAEANNKLYGFEYTDIDNCPVDSSAMEYDRTFGIFSGLVPGEATPPENNEYAALALMACCFGYNPGGETWAFKSLKMISTSSLTATQKSALKDINITTYLEYAGKSITVGKDGVAGRTLKGEWIDVIRFRDWLKNEIQINAFNVLVENAKVAFNDSYIGAFHSAILKALTDGQKAGGIDERAYDSDGNEIAPYTVSVPLTSSFSAAQKNSRQLTGLSWTARLSGAIHYASISGKLIS